MNGREEKCIQDFGRNTGRRHNFEGIDPSGRIIFKWILRKLVGMFGVDSSG
jgi:hypothetical protein